MHAAFTEGAKKWELGTLECCKVATAERRGTITTFNLLLPITSLLCLIRYR